MNDVIEQIEKSGVVLDGAGGEHPAFPTSMDSNEGRTIHDAVVEIGAINTLEVGMAYGMSTLHICEALRDQPRGRHIAIDPFQEEEFDNIGLLNLERAGLRDRVDFFSALSHMALPKLAKSGVTLDFALIDGAHVFDYAFVDFFYVDLMLRPGGIICLDDTWLLAIQKIARFYTRNRSYEIHRGRIPSPVGARIRRTVKHLVGPSAFQAVRRLLRRGGPHNRSTDPLLFLRKSADRPSIDWNAEYIIDF